MIHPPSPRHRKDGGPHEGGGEMPVSTASAVPVVEKYCVQYGWEILLFADWPLNKLYRFHAIRYNKNNQRTIKNGQRRQKHDR